MYCENKEVKRMNRWYNKTTFFISINWDSKLLDFLCLRNLDKIPYNIMRPLIIVLLTDQTGRLPERCSAIEKVQLNPILRGLHTGVCSVPSRRRY